MKKLKAFVETTSIKAYMAMQRASQAVFAVLMAALSAIVPSQALAQGIGQIGTNVANQGTGLTQMFLIGFGVVGFAMVGIGLIKWKNAKQSGESMGGIVGMIVIGAILLSIPAIIGVMQSSVFGTNEAQGTLDQLVQ